MVTITEALVASRRGFMLGAGATLIAKPKLLLGQLPKLWADGEHDDTDALNALLTGKPIKAAASGDTFLPLFSGGWAALKGGRYWIEGAIKPTVPFSISHATLRTAAYKPAMLDLSGTPPHRGRANAVFMHNVFELVRKTPDYYEKWGKARRWPLLSETGEDQLADFYYGKATRCLAT